MGPIFQGSPIGTSDSQDSIDGARPDPIEVRSGPGARELLSNVEGRFTENLGQFGEGAGSFYCMGEPLSVALGPGWVSYQHRNEEAQEGVMVRVDFEGADPVEPVGSEPASYPTNYLKGNDPDQWVIGARSYGQVRYEGLWDGIDLRYRFEGGMLKYDFIVEPFADISQIRLRYQGHSGLLLDEANGDLIIRTPVVDMVDTAPVSFQDPPGSSGDIRSWYQLLGARTVAFGVTGYDPSLPLVIDPGLMFSTFIGGSEIDGAEMEVDELGDIYMGGYTRSTDFPTTPGVISEYFLWGVQDAMVLKLKGDGSDLLFATFVGSWGFDGAGAIALDPDKNIVLAGWTNSSNFPTTPGALKTDPEGVNDCFVMKLNDNCTNILWSAVFGGSEHEAGFCIELMSNNDIMVAGPTDSDDFPMVSGCYDTTANGGQDWYAARINNNGTMLLGSTYIGGSLNESGWSKELVVGADDEVYIAIQTNSTDIPVSQDAFSKGCGGCWDTFVIKLDGNLTQMRYSTYLGGDNNDIPTSFVVDPAGCVQILGLTASDDYPTTPGALDRTRYPGSYDCYLTKLSADGSSLEWSTLFGGNDRDEGSYIQMDDDGLLYFTMCTRSDDLQTTEHAFDASHNGEMDIFLGVFDGENQSMRYGSYIGGSGDESPWALVSIHNGSAIITSMSTSDDYPTTPGAFDREYNGYYDIVASRLNVTLSDTVAPTPPLNLTASLVNHSVELAWESPARTGGLDLTGYRLLRGTAPRWLPPMAELDPEYLDHTDVPPEIGRTYYYAITAFNPAGESDWSNVVAVTYLTPPGPPSNLTLEAGYGTVKLNWTAPAKTGGLQLLGYHLYRGTDITNVNNLVVTGDEIEYLDENVTAGITYFYRVAAFNDVGVGNLTPVVSATPTGPPTVPLTVTATAGDGNVTLRWEPPANEGGIQLWGYKVLRGTLPDAIEEHLDLDGNTTELLDGPLENGQTYYYAVRAFNGLGSSPMSPVVNATPLGLPGAPRSLLLSADLGQVEITWEPPTDDGGSQISGYIVLRGTSETRLAQLVQLEPSNTSYIDTDPVYGQTNYYAVSAVSAQGVGPRTAAFDVLPFTLPDPPRTVTVEEDVGVVTITWVPPFRTGGSQVIRYNIYRGLSPDDLEPIKIVDADTQYHDDTDFVPGVTYYYAVSAVAEVGEGPLSEALAATPYTTPSAPVDPSYESTEGTVSISWGPPTEDGGRPVLSYRVYRGTDPMYMALIAEVQEGTGYGDAHVVEDLTYYYAVSAINLGGEGLRTPTIEVRLGLLIGLPGAPREIEVKVDGDEALITWQPPVEDGGSPVRGYVILRGTSMDDLREVALVDVGLSHRAEGLGTGRTYYYAVAAINIMGMGEPSRAVEAHIKAPDTASPLADPVLGLFILTVAFIVVALGAVLAFETVKYSMALLLLPLFSRFTRENVLDNKNRHAIHGLIIDNPGIHFNAIIKEYDLSMGVATYHLDVLEREKFIQSVRDGRRKRFYTSDTKVPLDNLRKTPEAIRETVMSLVMERPGISQMEIIRELGIDRKTVSYHIAMLIKEDKLEDQREGRFTVYRINGTR